MVRKAHSKLSFCLCCHTCQVHLDQPLAQGTFCCVGPRIREFYEPGPTLSTGGGSSFGRYSLQNLLIFSESTGMAEPLWLSPSLLLLCSCCLCKPHHPWARWRPLQHLSALLAYGFPFPRLSPSCYLGELLKILGRSLLFQHLGLLPVAYKIALQHFSKAVDNSPQNLIFHAHLCSFSYNKLWALRGKKLCLIDQSIHSSTSNQFTNEMSLTVCQAQ